MTKPANNRLLITLGLLGLLLVVLMSASCRRRRALPASIESVEMTETETVEPSTLRQPDDPVVLDTEWIDVDQPEHALSGQLLIDVSTRQDGQRARFLATLRIVLPDAEEKHWVDLPVGTRRVLAFKGHEYMVDVTEIRSSGARISIIRKL